ncbi:twin-arginine translocation signal domain-containing protein, partial [bacterium]|nr:twin-arginine translocation signal domain-containing protein [bacterium]
MNRRSFLATLRAAGAAWAVPHARPAAGKPRTPNIELNLA